MTQTYASLGSVSSATMRPEDLIPAFESALEDLPGGRDALDILRSDITPPGPDEEYAAWLETEDADWYLDGLTEALNEFAAPYCYFGSNEGDGADYGFWVSWDSLNDDCRYGGVLKIDAGDEWPNPLPEGTEYVLEVTDHGNGTLLTTAGAEVWSVV